MPAKTYECFICGEQVSKPKSWSVARLGLGDEGRACRNHEVVQEALKVLEENQQNQKAMAEAGRFLATRLLVEKIRVEEYFKGMKYPLLCYEYLKRQHGLTDKDVDEIKSRVEELGPLTATDVAVSLSAFVRARACSTP